MHQGQADDTTQNNVLYLSTFTFKIQLYNHLPEFSEEASGVWGLSQPPYTRALLGHNSSSSSSLLACCCIGFVSWKGHRGSTLGWRTSEGCHQILLEQLLHLHHCYYILSVVCIVTKKHNIFHIVITLYKVETQPMSEWVVSLFGDSVPVMKETICLVIGFLNLHLSGLFFPSVVFICMCTFNYSHL